MEFEDKKRLITTAVDTLNKVKGIDYKVERVGQNYPDMVETVVVFPNSNGKQEIVFSETLFNTSAEEYLKTHNLGFPSWLISQILSSPNEETKIMMTIMAYLWRERDSGKRFR